MSDRRSTSVSARRLFLVKVAILHFLGRRDESIRLGLTGIRRHIITNALLSSLYVHLSLLAGVPATLEALSRLKQTTGSVRLAPYVRDARRGEKAFRNVYGSRSKAVLRALQYIHPYIPAWVIVDVYGSVFSRKGLSFAEKELVTLTVLATGNHKPQFVSHLDGARRAGAMKREIQSALRLAARLSGKDLKNFLDAS